CSLAAVATTCSKAISATTSLMVGRALIRRSTTAVRRTTAGLKMRMVLGASRISERGAPIAGISSLKSSFFNFIQVRPWGVATHPAPAGTTADMILHRADGTSLVYNVGSNAILAGYSLGQIASGWQFAGLGRFFGTDSADMMLRNSVTGAFQVYDTMNNNITTTSLLGQVGLEWNIAGFGHFMAGGAGAPLMLTDNNGGGNSFLAYRLNGHKITHAPP